MTAISIAGMGLTGVLRITWVRDNLAHVLDHSHTDETSGTWTGLACPGHGLALGTDVDDATLRHLAAGSEIADLIWEAPDELTADHAEVFQAAMRAHHAGDSERAEQLWENLQAIWSQAWSANYAVLEFMQGTGPDPVRAGQAPALGGRLLRAPHQPSRPSPPPHPQHRAPQFDHCGERVLTCLQLVTVYERHYLRGQRVSRECALMYRITTSAFRLSAYRSDWGSSSATRHSPYRLSHHADQDR